jgi:hypothetical protein
MGPVTPNETRSSAHPGLCLCEVPDSANRHRMAGPAFNCPRTAPHTARHWHPMAVARVVVVLGDSSVICQSAHQHHRPVTHKKIYGGGGGKEERQVLPGPSLRRRSASAVKQRSLSISSHPLQKNCQSNQLSPKNKLVCGQDNISNTTRPHSRPSYSRIPRTSAPSSSKPSSKSAEPCWSCEPLEDIPSTYRYKIRPAWARLRSLGTRATNQCPPSIYRVPPSRP